ncbi:hypothetical protein K0M31_000178, partial [Melipona bicolor]
MALSRSAHLTSKLNAQARLVEDASLSGIHDSKAEGNITNKKRTGRPKKLTPREEKMIIREIKKNPSTSAPKVAAIVANSFGKD